MLLGRLRTARLAIVRSWQHWNTARRCSECRACCAGAKRVRSATALAPCWPRAAWRLAALAYSAASVPTPVQPQRGEAQLQPARGSEVVEGIVVLLVELFGHHREARGAGWGSGEIPPRQPAIACPYGRKARCGCRAQGEDGQGRHDGEGQGVGTRNGTLLRCNELDVRLSPVINGNVKK